MLSELMKEVQGFPRHLSIHSGGFTLSAQPIVETVPIEPARMEGRTIVQWDKDDLASLGLLKVDVLALGMLSALRKTFDYVNERAGPGKEKLRLETVPADDVKTYEMIRRADTVGVFQIESRAQMNMLVRLLPKDFYDLVVQVAIVRPGPIQGDMVHPYLRRRRGEESPDSPDPRLEKILKKTLGVPLFQEQVMKIAIELADFTPGESDKLRRAINAWKSSKTLDQMAERLMKGLLSSGLTEEFVQRIFKQIQGFSEYGFPESHAASFALLAYASSYLKCHHPAEFTCALVNSQPMGFYSTHSLIEAAKREQVTVLPVHPHLSEYDCTLEGGALRVGLRVVSGLGEADALAWVEERRKRPFSSLQDFLSRVKIANRALHHLAMGEAFECFGFDQRGALWEILAHRTLVKPSGGEQLGLFEGAGGSGAESGDFAPLSEFEAVTRDYSSYGLSTRKHPMQILRQTLPRKLAEWTTERARAAESKKVVRIAGLVITRQRPQTASGVLFATIEDETGFLDMIIHNHVEDRSGDVLLNEKFVIVTGRVEREKTGGGMSFLAQRFEALFRGGDELRVNSHDFR
jgi:error-prone DNA polymerase